MSNGEQSINQTAAPARLSLRTINVLEIVSVTISVLITTWAIAPLHLHATLALVPALLALILMIHSHRVRSETLGDLGFGTSHFGKALRLLLVPMLIGTVRLILVGYWSGSLQMKPRFREAVVILPGWGLLQQYILQGFVYRRLRFIFVEESSHEPMRPRLAILLTAFLFALVHAPNLSLMVLALVGGLIWTWTYQRAPNLFALALSHAFMSAIILLSLPTHSMRVGYDYFINQGF